MDAPPPSYSRFCDEDEPPYPGDFNRGILAFDHVDYVPDAELQQPSCRHPDFSSSTRHVTPYQTGRLVIQPSRPSRPPSYECISIVSIFFCMPMAICAIIYSHNSTLAASDGDIEEARKKGILARNIAIAAILFGIALLVLVCVYNAQINNLYNTM